MLHILFISLTWWQATVLAIYIIYTVIRAKQIYADGMKGTYLDYGEKAIRVYHIVWAVIDIPAIILGKFFPVLKTIFNIPVLKLPEKKEEKK